MNNINKNNAKNNTKQVYIIEHSALRSLSAEVATKHKSLLLISGLLVRSFVLQLPRMSKAKQLQAIRYALADDTQCMTDDANVSVSERAPTGKVGVYVMQEQDYRRVLQSAQQAAIDIDALVPDYLTLPVAADQISLAFLEDRVIFRSCQQQGGAVPIEHAVTLLQTLVEEHAVAVLHVFQASAEQQAICKQAYAGASDQLLFADVWTPVIEQGIINCLQKADAATQPRFKFGVAWSLGICMLTACLYFSSLLLVPMLVARHDQQLNAKMQPMLQAVAKQWGVPDADPEILQSYLSSALRVGKPHLETAELLLMLQRLQAALMQQRGLHVVSLSYAAAQLHVVLRIDQTAGVSASTALNSTVHTLQQHGLQLLQKKLQHNKDSVIVHLSFKGWL